MAAHIDSVRASAIAKVSKAEFYAQLRWGDLVFCAGNAPISKGIGLVTGSPFSHVLMAWLPVNAGQWLTLEATIDRGVHVGRLSDYTDGYDGDIVLTRRQVMLESVLGASTRRELTDTEKYAGLNAAFGVLEDAYDWRQEVSIVAHKLLTCLPVVKPKKEYYCSGLQWLISKAQGFPLQMPGPNLPTPEDNWTDPTVFALGALLKA